MRKAKSKTKQKIKIGVLGSTFNPPHFGHLLLAKTALQKFHLSKVLLMVCAIPPIRKKDLAPLKHRTQMAKLLAKYDKHFEVSNLEIKRAQKGKKSYTLDTYKELQQLYPEAEIYWIIGEDSLDSILAGRWKRGEKGIVTLLSQIKFIVATRQGYKMKHSISSFSPQIQKLVKQTKKMKVMSPISSTLVREKTKKGESINNLVPKNITLYIKKHKLYN